VATVQRRRAMPDAPASAVTAYVALGANLGDATAALQDALRRIAELPSTRLVLSSSVYRTAPIESTGPDYLNAVCKISTALGPHELLAALQSIELAHGRERPYRNAPRTLDLDLLLHGSALIETPELTLPHPRMHLRAFVLRPLAEIAPGLVIPGHGSVQHALAAVADQRIDRLGP
jgi:2-amino-4-hydroxy-6-hydroxymethyldihydropteridine diphosphokinase